MEVVKVKQAVGVKLRSLLGDDLHEEKKPVKLINAKK
jgi:hypothetical protein